MINRRGARAAIAAIALAAIGTGSCTEASGPLIISPPSNVTVTLLTPTSARVTWTAPPEATAVESYNVVRDGTKIGETSNTSYDDTGLVEGVTYRYQVSANGVSGELSALSSETPAATITAPDVTAPAVLSTSPAAGTSAVARVASIAATFSESLDPTTINATTFIVKGPGNTTVPGTVTYLTATRVAEFKADGMLPNSAAITVSITTGVKDAGGNALAADFTFSFSTRDEVPPVVTSTSPANASSAVPVTGPIAVTFDEPLDAATITTASLVVAAAAGGAPVAGVVSFDPATRTATFTPAAALQSMTGYTVTVTTSVKDAAGNALATAYSFSFTTGDASAPSILSASPANGATGIAVGSVPSVVFSEPMDESTINATTMSLRATGTGTPVSAVVAYVAASKSATLTPSVPLSYSTSYTLVVTTGAKDLAGNALGGGFSSEFTTAAQPDLAAPTILSTVPANGATNVPIGSVIAVAFSEAMEPASITGSTFTLTLASSGASVSGAIGYDPAANAAVFTPSAALAFATVYTATISTGARDLAGNPLTAPVSWTFTTASAPDVLAPTIVATAPADGSAGVSVNVDITVTFSEAMDPLTINGTTVRLVNNATAAAVAGTVSYNAGNNTATFAPNSPLAFATGYSITVTTGARDGAGNPLATAFTAIFTTSSAPDTSAPTVLAVTPPDGATNVSVAAAVTVAFSEAMDPLTINGTTVRVTNTATSAAVAGAVSYNASNNTATFAPDTPLGFATGYTVTVTTGAKDAAGNPLATAFTAVFTTSSAPDTSGPTVVAVAPADGATNVSVAAVVTVTFSETMDPLTVNDATVRLTNNSTSATVSGTVSYNAMNNTATFTPNAPLAFATGYTITITTGAKDAAGNPLATPFTAIFATGSAPDTSAPTVVTVAPANGTTNVSVGSAVTVTFSEAMNAGTMNSSTVRLSVTSSGSTVPGALGYNQASRTATFTPSAPLAYSTSYTVTVTTGAQDAAGNALASTFTSAFVTGAAPDNTAPTVSATVPTSGATNIAITSLVTVTFSEEMSTQTINGNFIKLTNTATSAEVAGAISYNSGTNTATFTPSSALTYSTGYTIGVSTGVRDLAGNQLASAFSASFTTVAPPDNTPPTVTAMSPAHAATMVTPHTVVKVTFSEEMDQTTINGATFRVVATATSAVVAGAISYDPATRVATFTPSSPLAFDTEYTTTVTTGAKDAAGNGLAATVSATFRTANLQNVTGYWSGTTADGSLHVHFALDEPLPNPGVNFTLRGSNCGGRPDQCRVYPLTAQGQTYLQSLDPADVTSGGGTFPQPDMTFTFTANGIVFTYTATVSDGSFKMTGTISGGTLPPTSLVMGKEGP